jgi:hypothetical protein
MSNPAAERRGERPDKGGSETLTSPSPPDLTKSVGFRGYLRHYARGSASWSALADTLTRLDKEGVLTSWRFDAEKYIEALISQGPDGTGELSEPELAEQISALLQVETEWRLDQRLRHPKSASKTDVVTARDWMQATPEDSILNRCRYVLPGGSSQCGRGTVPGTSRCRDHGGTLVDEKTRRAVLMGAYLGLVDATDLAVSTLSDVAMNGRNELARVQAARELLDRAGLTADLNVTVRIEGDERTNRITALQERLDTMGTSLRSRVAGAIEASAAEQTTVESEHVTVANPPEPDDVTVAPEDV